MKFFVDTGNIKDIESLMPLGIVDGVTTNPSLMAKEGGDPRAIIKQICQLVKGPVSAEVVATDAAGMIREGRDWAAFDEHIVVKVPFTREGVKALKALVADEIKVNVTLCFSPTQALLAAKASAWCVSPFVGRLDDIGQEGMAVVREIVEIFDRYHLPTQVLAASLRHPLHVVQAAQAGAHIATMPYSVFQAMFKHPLTDAGIQKFLEDARKAAKVKA